MIVKREKRDLFNFSHPRRSLCSPRLHPLPAILLLVGIGATLVLRDGGRPWGSVFGGGGGASGSLQGPWQPPQQDLLPPPQGQNDSYVAMCIAVRDEHCDIREWVLHHASIGVGRVYLFDTQSSPPMASVLEDLIGSGLVEYNYVTNDTEELHLETPATPGRSYNWQGAIYPLCLQRYGQRHRWMAFIDADEFIVLEPGVPSLPSLLQRYEQYGGLVLHWRLFSSGGHVLRPPGGVLASYTTCCEDYGSRTVKSIVQPRHTRRPKTVHSFLYDGGQYAVNTAGVQVEGSKQKGEASYRGAALHHYISKSLFDFDLKMQRGEGTGAAKTLSSFLTYYRQCRGSCSQAVGLGQQLSSQYNLTWRVPEACLPQQGVAGAAPAAAAE